jgi:hypothetical protein
MKRQQATKDPQTHSGSTQHSTLNTQHSAFIIHRSAFSVLLACLLAAVAVAVFLAQEIYYYDQFIDDAYISFHYARNLAEGKGLTFNPGEYVEGYSNFLWVVLLAAGIRLGGDALVLAKIFGGLFGVLVLAATFFLTKALAGRKREKLTDPIPAGVATLLLASNTYLAYWSSLGLETALFTCALAAAFALAVWETENDKHAPLSAIACIVVFLSRPEGIFYVVPLLAVRGWLWMCGRKPCRRDAIGFGIIAATFLGYFAWKLAVYGRFYPNTYYAKTPPPFLAYHPLGLRYVGCWFAGIGWTNGVVALIALLVGGALLRGRALLFILPAAAVFLYAYLVEGDWMGNYRFLVPALPFLYGLAALGAWRATEWSWSHRKAWGIAVAVPVVALFALHATRQLALRHDGGLAGPTLTSYKERSWFLNVRQQTQHGFIPPLDTVAEYVLASTRPGDRILFPDIGLMAYATRCSVFDSRGLTNRATADLISATRKGRNAEAAHQRFLEHFFTTSPTLAALVLRKEDGRGTEMVDQLLVENARFRGEYREVKRQSYYGNNNLVFFANARWQGPLDTDSAIERFRVLLRENPHVAHFYVTFIRLLSNAGRKDEARNCYAVYEKRFPALVRKARK